MKDVEEVESEIGSEIFKQHFLHSILELGTRVWSVLLKKERLPGLSTTFAPEICSVETDATFSKLLKQIKGLLFVAEENKMANDWIYAKALDEMEEHMIRPLRHRKRPIAADVFPFWQIALPHAQVRTVQLGCRLGWDWEMCQARCTLPFVFCDLSQSSKSVLRVYISSYPAFPEVSTTEVLWSSLIFRVSTADAC